jgi:hypothetical protein
MRTTRDILADILERPELDELRLEYADACEAKDPNYARYIRTELEYWRPGSSIHTPEGSEQVAKRISHPIMQYCYSVHLYRGFVEEVTMDPYVFINRGDVLLDLAPIRRITFTPKPLPIGLALPHLTTLVPSSVPELMACRHLRRVDTVSFRDTNFQSWYLDKNDIESALASEHLQTLIGLGLPGGPTQQDWSEDYTTTVWERAFARSEFRKMLWIGFPHHPGEKALHHEDGWDDVIEVEPMTERGRAFEQRYGYLPTLHWANRWGADSHKLMTDQESVLAVQRGELPIYPVGTPLTEEMYVPPPTKRSSPYRGGD